MPFSVDSLQLDVLSADPVSPAEGQVWYNTTDKALRIFRNSATKDVGSLKLNVAASSPLATDDSASGYEVGSTWLNSSTGAIYICLSAGVGTAVWLCTSGGYWKNACRAATTAALPANTFANNVLTASANGALAAQDGVTLAVGDRFLVKNEATAANNGIYKVTSLGSAGTPWVLTRASCSADSISVRSNQMVAVAEGTTNGATVWRLSTLDPITLNSTGLSWAQFSGGGGGGATPAGASGDVQFKGPGSTLAAETTAGYGFNYSTTTHALTVGPSGTNLSNNPFSANGNVNSYVQSNVQNTNNGTTASSDLVATADNGNDNTRYVDFGINGSGWADATWTINGVNDGYVYCAGGAMALGTDSNKDIIFFTGGTLAVNDRGRITGVGNWVVGRAALATNATDGFIYMPGTAGVPTGSPTAFAGRSPFVVDTSNNVLYFNTNSVWQALDPARIPSKLKDNVRVATTAALPANTRTGNVLTATANGTITAQDGITLAVGDRILVKNEATGANNGIYTVTSVGSGGSQWVLTRAADADTSSDVLTGMSMLVTSGDSQGGDTWQLTTSGAITLNTTALTFGLVQSKAKYNEVNAAGTITTGSTSDVVATSMTLTPGAGTYMVIFSALVYNSAAANTTTISAYANGVQVANSERGTGAASATYRAAASLTCVVTVAAGQAIDIRWRVSAGTGSMGNRSLALIKVA